jgi:alkylation response protein AidB-like acyl-CoA dehydrogenase
MALVLTEEQQILQQTARDFVAAKSSTKRLRALRDSRDPIGFSRDLWREMAALGWAGIVIPESHGGAGMGFADLAVVLEEAGRGLLPEPLISTVLLGAGAILLGGSDEQKREMLPAVAAGELLLALGWQEAGSRYDPFRIATRAERSGGGFRLSGEKIQVLDAPAADRILISARTSGDGASRDGITLFLVEAAAKGVSRERQWLVDSRAAAIVRLDGIEVPSSAVVGELDRGGALLERVLDRAAAGLSAEMLGAMLAAFEMTLDYLKTRKQFGVLIGTFQALKHRAANVYTETELARSAVMACARAIDAEAANVADLVDLTKARCGDAFVLATNEAVQMHGGIGMTDEHDVGFYMKRARAADTLFGDAAWHRARYAARHGY